MSGNSGGHTCTNPISGNLQSQKKHICVYIRTWKPHVGKFTGSKKKPSLCIYWDMKTYVREFTGLKKTISEYILGHENPTSGNLLGHKKKTHICVYIGTSKPHVGEFRGTYGRSRENFPLDRFLKNFYCSLIMSYLCQKCKKNWGSPSLFQRVENYPDWDKLAHVIQHGLQGLTVKNIEGESTEANDLSLIL